MCQCFRLSDPPMTDEQARAYRAEYEANYAAEVTARIHDFEHPKCPAHMTAPWFADIQAMRHEPIVSELLEIRAEARKRSLVGQLFARADGEVNQLQEAKK